MPRVARFRRKPRRFLQRKRNHIPRGLHAPHKQLKPYNYTFNLDPQLLRNDPTVVASAAIVPSSAVVPISPGALGVFVGTMAATGYVDLGLSSTFALTDIQNYSTFANMYDAYKINSITVDVEYLHNSSIAAGGGVLPTVWMYWDQDDAVPPINVNRLTGKQGVKRWDVGDKMKSSRKFRFIPLTQNAGTTTGTALGAPIVPNKSQWINCQAPQVPHYAFKMWIQDFYTPGPTSVDVINAFRFNWKYNVSFRSPISTN